LYLWYFVTMTLKILQSIFSFIFIGFFSERENLSEERLYTAILYEASIVLYGGIIEFRKVALHIWAYA